MNHEETDIETLVKRYTSVDGAEGSKRQRYYVAIYGGTTSSKARKLAANVPLDDGRSPEELVQDVIRRLQTAKAEGPKKLYVRAYQVGDSAPADVVICEGESGARADGVEDEGLSLASAHANVVAGLLAENRWLSSQLQAGAAQFAELTAKAAATWAELEVRQDVGFGRSLSDGAAAVTANLAPHLGEIAKIIEALRAQVPGASAPSPGTPGGTAAPAAEGDHPGRVREAVGRVEASATHLGTVLVEAAGAGAMTPELVQEVKARLSALVAAMGIGA